MSIVHKTTLSDGDSTLGFIFSDETEDHYGDIIRASGWRFDKFANGNPIALFNHDSSFVVGRWTRVRVEGTRLKGVLVLAPPGSSQRIDEIRALVGAGILRACSVGFRPIQQRPRGNGGIEYLEQELTECSIVAVGANPSALMEARRLGVSNEVIKMIFKQGKAFDVAENIARSRSSSQRRYTPQQIKEIHEKAKAMLAKDKKPKLLTMSDERAAKTAHAKAVHERAKALLKSLKDERAYQAYQPRRDPPPSPPEDSSAIGPGHSWYTGTAADWPVYPDNKPEPKPPARSSKWPDNNFVEWRGVRFPVRKRWPGE